MIKQKVPLHKADRPQPNQDKKEEQKQIVEKLEYEIIEDYESRLEHLDECAFESIDDKLKVKQNEFSVFCERQAFEIK